MAFIKTGRWVVNTNSISDIDTCYAGDAFLASRKIGYVIVTMDNKQIFSFSQDSAKDLLEWVDEATIKCKYCNRFDCNCGAN